MKKFLGGGQVPVLLSQKAQLPGRLQLFGDRKQAWLGGMATVTPDSPARQEQKEDTQQQSLNTCASTCSPSAAPTTPTPSPNKVIMNSARSKFKVVLTVAEELGMTFTEDDASDWNLFWSDKAVKMERLKPHQYANHFPGMNEISHKDSLARNMERLRKLHKDEFTFVPRSWVLPGEYHSLACHMREIHRQGKSKTLIVKPPRSAGGKGMYLTHSLENIDKDQNIVVQEYIEKPFLLEGFKMDLRLYVLVTSCDPLRVFMYNDGLVKMSAEPYISPLDVNLNNSSVHLTNSDDESTKRTFPYLNSLLREKGYSDEKLWAKIHDIVAKTMIIASPYLVHSYRACQPDRSKNQTSQFFEVLGFDVVVDDCVTPWLLEVNRAPCFAAYSEPFWQMKTGVIRDALRMVSIRSRDEKNLAHQTTARHKVGLEEKEQEILEHLQREKSQLEHEQQTMGGYVRIYPSMDSARDRLYQTLLKSASDVALITGKEQDNNS